MLSHTNNEGNANQSHVGTLSSQLEWLLPEKSVGKDLWEEGILLPGSEHVN